MKAVRQATTVRCPECGQSRTVSPAHRSSSRRRGRLCPACAGKRIGRLNSQRSRVRTLAAPCGATIVPRLGRCETATRCPDYLTCLDMTARACWRGWRIQPAPVKAPTRATAPDGHDRRSKAAVQSGGPR